MSGCPAHIFQSALASNYSHIVWFVNTLWWLCLLNHNIISGLDIASDTVGTTCCLPIKDNKDRWEVEEAPGKRAYVSVSLQQWGMCALYCRYCYCSLTHSVHQLTRELHHILSRGYWSCGAGPHGSLMDDKVSLAIFSCERGPCDPGVCQMHHSNRNREVVLTCPPITSWYFVVFCCFNQLNISVSIQGPPPSILDCVKMYKAVSCIIWGGDSCVIELESRACKAVRHLQRKIFLNYQPLYAWPKITLTLNCLRWMAFIRKFQTDQGLLYRPVQ